MKSLVSNSPQTPNEPKVLGAFVSTLSLFSIALYFTGWIYRYAYYGSFRVDINALNLPLQSFFFIPISVVAGSAQGLLKAALLLILAIAAILLYPVALKRLLSRFRRRTQSPLLTLLRDLVIVILLLACLYWIARSQGESDAKRDAVNTTSKLPIVALVHPDKDLGIGRNPRRLMDEPALQKDLSQQKTRVIGDVALFEKLRQFDIKTSDDPPDLGDWRLLVNSNGWLYLIRTLPETQINQQRFPTVLAVREGGGEQVMILESAP